MPLAKAFGRSRRTALGEVVNAIRYRYRRSASHCARLCRKRSGLRRRPLVFVAIRASFWWLRYVFADGAYGGQKLKGALQRLGRWTLKIVKRSDASKSFEVQPRRRVVERTLTWLNRNRRLAKDFESTNASAETWIMIASVQLMIHGLARP